MQKDLSQSQGTAAQNNREGNHIVFVGNYNEGIVCANNIDGVFGEGVPVTGALAAKARAVATRAVWYLKDGDAALLYEQPDRRFLNYASRLYGHDFRVLAPSAIVEEPLDLFKDVHRDTRLLSELREGVTRHGWRISPFIQSPSSAHLAHEVDAQLDGGMCRDAVKRGLALDLNDKQSFTEICKSLGIRVPSTTYVRGWDNLVKAVHEYRRRWGGLMLRIARAAGGLGNLIIRADDDIDARLAKVFNDPGWQTETVVVGQLLQLQHSPASLAFIESDGSVRLISDSTQILKGGSAYVGSLAPSGLDATTVALMHEWMIKYASHVSHLGARGYINIDWITDTNGALYAVESNFRYTAVVHPLSIRARLCNGDSRVARSHDALHVKNDLRFDDALAHLKAEGLLFDPQTKTGAVITIPPARGNMGYVVLAETPVEATTMATAIHRCLEHEPHSDHEDI